MLRMVSRRSDRAWDGRVPGSRPHRCSPRSQRSPRFLLIVRSIAGARAPRRTCRCPCRTGRGARCGRTAPCSAGPRPLAVLRELDAQIVQRVEVRRLQCHRALPPGDGRPAVALADRHHRQPGVPLRRLRVRRDRALEGALAHRRGAPRRGVLRRCSRTSSRSPDRSRGCDRTSPAPRRRGRGARRRCRARSTRRGSARSRPPASADRSPRRSGRLRSSRSRAESGRRRRRAAAKASRSVSIARGQIADAPEIEREMSRRRHHVGPPARGSGGSADRLAELPSSSSATASCIRRSMSTSRFGSSCSP